MTDNKNRRSPLPVEVTNPRYKGATPEMVARALLQPKPKQDDGDDEDDEETWPIIGHHRISVKYIIPMFCGWPSHAGHGRSGTVLMSAWSSVFAWKLGLGALSSTSFLAKIRPLR